MNKPSELFKKRDLILMVSLVLIFLAFYWSRPKEGLSVEVYIAGELSMKISAPGSYELHEGNKYLMKVVFDGRKVHVEEANCPLKICEKTGDIKPGGTIVCVPNKVLIKFEKAIDGDVDVMTW